MKLRNTATVIVAILLLHTMSVSADLIWAGLTNWTEITIAGVSYSDPSDQSPASTDLIGESGNSAGYWQLTEAADPADDVLSFRIRVSDMPNNPQNVWQILLDTDGNGSYVEWMLQLNYSGKDTGVFLTKTINPGGSGLTLGDIQTESTNHWEGTTSGYSQMTLAGTNLDNKKEDAFIDIGISWQKFKELTGVSSVNELRVAVTTSTTHSGVNKDAPLSTDNPDQILISDTLSDTIPEPTVVTLILGAGGGLIFYRRFRRRYDDENPED